MAMPQGCYLAKEAKRPSHTTNMQPFQLSLFTFGTQLSAFGEFVKVTCLGLNCRGTQLTLFAFGTQFVLGLNRCLTHLTNCLSLNSIVTSFFSLTSRCPLFCSSCSTSCQLQVVTGFIPSWSKSKMYLGPYCKARN